MQRVARRTRRGQRNPQIEAELAALWAVMLVTLVAIGSTLGIVMLARHVVAEVAPAAIGAISANTLGAVAAVGVVLRRRSRSS